MILYDAQQFDLPTNSHIVYVLLLLNAIPDFWNESILTIIVRRTSARHNHVSAQTQQQHCNQFLLIMSRRWRCTANVYGVYSQKQL